MILVHILCFVICSGIVTRRWSCTLCTIRETVNLRDGTMGPSDHGCGIDLVNLLLV
jgi:hypothetical protein